MSRFEGERLFSDYLDGETGWGGSVCSKSHWKQIWDAHTGIFLPPHEILGKHI